MSLYFILLIVISLLIQSFITYKKVKLFSYKTSLLRHYIYCSNIWLLSIICFIFFTLYSLSNINIFIVTILSLSTGLTLNYILSSKFLIPSFKAKKHSEKWIKNFLFICAGTSISITIMIILSILVESIEFFKIIPFSDFIFGTKWSPQTAIRSDQAGGSGAFGAIPVFAGTLMITFIAMLIAVPIGLMSAIYLSEYSNRRFRNYTKPILEILAGVPTVVYGYFAVVTFAPWLRDLGISMNLDISSESALAAGIIMGIMIIPFVLSLSDDVISSVPQTLRDASIAIGATKSETITKIIIPAAFPGIMASILLALSRAIGETMIVVMAAGLSSNLTANPFESVTTVTVQIVTLLVGDQEFSSAKTLSAFALGLTLFVITLILNIISAWIVKKYQEKYE